MDIYLYQINIIVFNIEVCTQTGIVIHQRAILSFENNYFIRSKIKSINVMQKYFTYDKVHIFSLYILYDELLMPVNTNLTICFFKQ